ncbi:hypothetical protein EJ08DRAFT_440803 [Tothia fuscella]|uniref:Uncharacterized protein n=1 Tax=Tothia fuscella TaxID=1048955 RepID=A0A9P4NJH8_9PEZI|nr:hypothetical protein EJ08DRAFT_440803 [Tothia fuscella]
MMLTPYLFPGILLGAFTHVLAQQQCYFGPEPMHRGSDRLQPCTGDGLVACCLLGDICYAGNACWNYNTGVLYQYGCTDINYRDASCPYKCGGDTELSPWTGLEYCENDTWLCHNPESCLVCQWNTSQELFSLTPLSCASMGSKALVALYAPSKLAPYVSLPSTYRGQTGYFSPFIQDGTTTWDDRVKVGYKPNIVNPWATYPPPPSSKVIVNRTLLGIPSPQVQLRLQVGKPAQEASPR